MQSFRLIHLQTKFGARCRAWNVAQFNQEAPPSIRLRLDDELNVPASISNDFIVKDKKEILRLVYCCKLSNVSLNSKVREDNQKENCSFGSSWFNHKLEVRCTDLSMTLSMSTVIGLSDLSEDEIISKPLPMEILLDNLKITLIEDRPPVNITSPGKRQFSKYVNQMVY